MRIHTDTLTHAQVFVAAQAVNTYPEVLTTHGSRKRKHAFEVQLSGSSPRDAQSGQWKAATWDEWGAFIGRIFALDPNASMSYYEDAETFHRVTCDRFREGTVPADTHAQHKWVYDFEKSNPWGGSPVHYCNRCSARTTR